VHVLSLFSKLPQLSILWLQVTGKIGGYTLPSAVDLAECSVAVPIFFQVTLTRVMIHGNRLYSQAIHMRYHHMYRTCARRNYLLHLGGAISMADKYSQQIQSNSWHVHVFSMIHCPGLRRLHCGCILPAMRTRVMTWTRKIHLCQPPHTGLQRLHRD
jgi:hypothetical protein